MRLLNPWALLFAIPTLILTLMCIRRLPLSRRSLYFTQLPLLGGGRGWGNSWMALVPELLLAMALMSWTLALARPQSGWNEEVVDEKGVDVILALDVSSSMAALDFAPSNRLGVAKNVVGEFIHRRRGDRVGLVTFAGAPFLRCPLTLDYQILQSIIKDLNVVEQAGLDGTAIGDALVLAGERLQTSKARSRLVIVLTDGKQNRGQTDPVDGAEILAREGIRVYAVGIGTEGSVPVPVHSRGGGRVVRQAIFGFDEDTLRNVAKIGGGRYFYAKDANALRATFSEINHLEKSGFIYYRLRHWGDRWFGPLLLGILLALVSLVWQRGGPGALP